MTLKDVGGNAHALSEIWLKAVKVSNNHQDRRKSQDVTRTVADRLVGNQLKRFESAGDLYRNIELFREAVQAYVDGRAWNKARQCCDQDAPKVRGKKAGGKVQ